MKRQLAVILTGVMLLGVGIALAVGNTGTDPMISVSYWENTYLPALTESLEKRAGEASVPIYEKAVGKLDSLGEADVKAAQAQKGGYIPAEAKAGATLTLDAGGSMILYSGACTVDSGTLADVTQGAEVSTGAALAAAHRYVATSNAVLRQTTAGSLGYQGKATLNQDSGGVTPPSGGDQPGGKALPFDDVKADNWYYGAVSFVYEKGYFAGTAANAFSPNDPMNRAMVATVLHRVAGNETTRGGTDFSDVPAGQWYSDGIAWASAKGVVNGMGGGRYEPMTAVTREQLVTMLYRFEKDYRKVAAPSTGSLSAFPDGDKVSSWARDAMGWAVGAGLIQGRNTGELDPAGTATRAEVATILQRFSGRLS